MQSKVDSQTLACLLSFDGLAMSAVGLDVGCRSSLWPPGCWTWVLKNVHFGFLSLFQGGEGGPGKGGLS